MTLSLSLSRCSPLSLSQLSPATPPLSLCFITATCAVRLLWLFGAEAAPSFYLFIVFVCVAALVLLVDTVGLVVVVAAVVGDVAAVIKYCTCLRHSWHHSTFLLLLLEFLCACRCSECDQAAKDFDIFFVVPSYVARH